MKVKTDMHAGNFSDDAYSYVRETLAGIPRFVRQADEEAATLYQEAFDSTQLLWGKLRSLF